jgi:hypothetical protein
VRAVAHARGDYGDPHEQLHRQRLSVVCDRVGGQRERAAGDVEEVVEAVQHVGAQQSRTRDAHVPGEHLGVEAEHGVVQLEPLTGQGEGAAGAEAGGRAGVQEPAVAVHVDEQMAVGQGEGEGGHWGGRDEGGHFSEARRGTLQNGGPV